MSIFAEYLAEWATGNRQESYLDVFLETGDVRHCPWHGGSRTARGKALRAHLFGSERAPSSKVVRAAIQAHGSAATLAAKLKPAIDAGLEAPFGALAAGLRSSNKPAATRRANQTPMMTTGGPINIRFADEMFTFVAVPDHRTISDMPGSRGGGVYLWCIEYEGAYLVNYVGKALREKGFRARLTEEYKDYLAGRYCTPVDVDWWKLGVRVELPSTMSPEQLEREHRELVPLFRILLIPLEASDVDPLLVESAIVRLLRNVPAAGQFLCNRPKGYVREAVLEFGANAPRVIGLTGPVPDALRVQIARQKNP